METIFIRIINLKIRKKYTCPLEIVHDFIRGKWKTIILYQLKHGGKSLAELENGIEGISQKMLLQDLSELIEFDLVRKKKFIGYPLKVQYYLSEDRGGKIMEAINIMQTIGKDYMVEHGMEKKQKEVICYQY